jgi:hypothetical protein
MDDYLKIHATVAENELSVRRTGKRQRVHLEKVFEHSVSYDAAEPLFSSNFGSLDVDFGGDAVISEELDVNITNLEEEE